MKNVLIFNAIPTNNGDAALVFSLFEALKKKNFNVKIAVQNYNLVKSIYKEYPFVKELTDYPIFSKFPLSKYVKSFFTPIMFLFSKEFKQADVLIASPGGYINSYYGFSRVAMTILTAKMLGKQTAIYSQSFGPFNNIDKKLLKFIARFVDVMYARDEFSFNILRELNIKQSKYFLVEDAAFLIPFEPSPPRGRKIAISVRDWKHDERSSEAFQNMIRLYVTKVVENGYEVEFVSTCQGLSGYIDDSKVAARIASTLPDKIRKRVQVNTSYFKLEDLKRHIDGFDAVIGTRLHMCILSMLRGKPCLNISYEIKGKEAYSYLGLEKFSVDYNESYETSEAAIEYFLNNLEEKRRVLREIMPRQNSKSNEFFEAFLGRLNLRDISSIQENVI